MEKGDDSSVCLNQNQIRVPKFYETILEEREQSQEEHYDIS